MIPEAKTMIKQQRWAAIIDLCRENTAISVGELVSLLRVSEATVRRDLQQMEDLNMVSRYHGGVRLNDGQSEEPPMLLKSETNISSKNQVARLAASMIKDNQMIYVDAGSSTYEMLNYVRAKNITVVTIGLPHIAKLKRSLTHTILLGGTIRWTTEAVTGNLTLRQLDDLFFDIAFLGVNGIHEKVGFTTTNEQEADVKAKVIAHSSSTFVLADGSKFNKLYPVKFSRLDQAVILSDEIPDFDRSQIRYQLTNGESKLD